MTRDPSSYIAASAEHLAETLTKKNSDYAPTGEFSNFEKAADIAGISVMQLITAQIAIKMTRIEKLLNTGSVSNEPLLDSFLDLAGYAIIGNAWLQYTEDPEKAKDVIADTFITDREIIRNLVDDECFHSWVQVGNDVSECGCCGEQRHG